jgi:hypothetical protein
VIDEPWKRESQGIGIVNATHCDISGLAECIINGCGDRRLSPMVLGSQCNDMHDRKDTGSLKIFLLERFEIWEQAHDPEIAS